jgi:hypothetical protein
MAAIRDIPALNQHWMALFDKKFLHAGNLFDPKTGQYRTATVTIERFEERKRVEMGGGRKEDARILHFVGKRTPMIVTPTMATVLVRMFGPTPKDCEGKQITLYVERSVNTGKGTGDVLRIKNDKAASRLKAQLRNEPPPEDDGPPAEPPEPPENFGEEVGDGTT